MLRTGIFRANHSVLVSKHHCQRRVENETLAWLFSINMMRSSNGNFSRVYWPFVRGIHRSPVNSPHKGQLRGALMLYLICVWLNGWFNNHEAGDLRRHRAHYDVIVMLSKTRVNGSLFFPECCTLAYGGTGSPNGPGLPHCPTNMPRKIGTGRCYAFNSRSSARFCEISAAFFNDVIWPIQLNESKQLQPDHLWYLIRHLSRTLNVIHRNKRAITLNALLLRQVVSVTAWIFTSGKDGSLAIFEVWVMEWWNVLYVFMNVASGRLEIKNVVSFQ